MLEERRTLEELARRSGGAPRAGDAVEIRCPSARSCMPCGRGLPWSSFRVESTAPADAEMNPYLDLVAVSWRSPRGSICLNSALSFWDLTDEIPAEVHLAVPRGSHRPRISYPPVRVHVFAAYTFDLGREGLRQGSGRGDQHLLPGAQRGRCRAPQGTGGDRRRIRGPPTVICDRPGASTGELLRLARRLRTGGPMADALEVLTD